MAKMTLNQYRGFLGEAAMTETLLSFGMSVNSLASSDFGLDIHAQLPEGSPFAESAPSNWDSPSWNMSGRTAHFQVKTVTEGNTPRVSVHTLKNWVQASAIGTPTFVLISRLEDEVRPTTPYAYVTPTGLRHLLGTGRNGAATRKISFEEPEVGVPFERRSFYARLELWTLAPAFMATAESRLPLPDRYGVGPMGSTQEFDVRVTTLLADLGHTYLSFFHPGGGNGVKTIKKLTKELADAYQGNNRNGGRPVGPWSQDPYVLAVIEQDIASKAGTVPLLPPGSFTSSALPGQARKDLLSLIVTLSRFQPYVYGKPARVQ